MDIQATKLELMRLLLNTLKEQENTFTKQSYENIIHFTTK